MRSGLFGAVPLSQFFIENFIGAGDRVVDATCGNGGDTLFLARLVGPDGRVFAFDLHEGAVRHTRELLLQEGLLDRVTLVHEGHERLREHVPHGVRGVMFNLGSLPRCGDAPPTAPDTTLAALEQGEELLAVGGIIALCIYTGHEGGGGEAEVVERWGAGLPPAGWNVWRCRQANRSPAAPYLLLAEKVRE
ncbi:MAG TPA: class I SAM-dependent methyltransferase [Verrucomicrobiae bacterium]|nr:class I SAM-dependent methyltransferase [Verrucomicrobiae bacterium]